MFRFQSVLVTGGTGTFGREFVRQALRQNPRRVIVFSRDELKQSEMQKEFTDERMRWFIGDVRDAARMRQALMGVDVVVHAAAMKQVPACEYNPIEAVKTNVLGAQNVIEAAIDSHVKQVVFISSDKAVSPVNLYGATKLCAEKLFVDAGVYVGRGPTKFSVVRYGNVIGSRGSVVPLFKEQAQRGLLTITDERMSRFWLTIEHGVEFVMECLRMQYGSEVFVPKLPSMRITDLAEALAPGVPRTVTGIRRGEKLHEVLVSEDDARRTYDCGDKYVIANTGALPYGIAVPADFRYASDSNSEWLSVDELRRLVG